MIVGCVEDLYEIKIVHSDGNAFFADDKEVV